jgi:hypothetical protein
MDPILVSLFTLFGALALFFTFDYFRNRSRELARVAVRVPVRDRR